MNNGIYLHPRYNKCQISNILSLKKILVDNEIQHTFECRNSFNGNFTPMNDILLSETCNFIGIDEKIKINVEPFNTLCISCKNCKQEDIIMLRLLFEEKFSIVKS